MDVIDLFCGVGGLTYGLNMSGLNVLAGVDIDSSCEYAYTKNNKAKFINESVSDINIATINNIFSNTDIKIIVGCAPCQPFSNHQKDKKNRKSHKDWGLLNDFLHIVVNVKPDIISMENVPSLINEEIFNDFVNGLTKAGYFINYGVHNTIDYGMAQNRRRLLLLASLHGKINFADDKEEPKTVNEVIGNMNKLNAGEQDDTDPLHISSKLSELNIKRIRASKEGGTWRDWSYDLLPDCYKKDTGRTYSSVYGRMEGSKYSPTLTTQFYSYGTGRFGHPTEDRAISLREGALLQSFPEDYAFVENKEDIKITKIARQIGNAVPPRLGLHIGRSIVEHLKNNNLI